ncbi:MAG: hypothetical protein QM817_35845 [Archangium sp.]
MRAHFVAVLSVALCACGGAMSMDAGVDGGTDAGRTMMTADAGSDAGTMMDVDAGPPPPRVVFGSMTVNGVSRELWTGYGTTTQNATQLRLGTKDDVMPKFMVTLVLPASAGAGFMGTCGMNGDSFFSVQHIADAGTAFFTLNSTCMTALTATATMADEDYVGTFSGTADWEPRSVLDAGYPQIVITNGSFTVKRTF